MDQFVQDNFWLILLTVLWTTPWKGVALWKASQKKHLKWFVALLVLNTFAGLEILYIFIFSKSQPKTGQSLAEKKKEEKRKK
ncbi:hypothetical protein HOD96_01970 [Candidatus Falkowbacteria bacterium]|jgi:hypothetical protein|nr:hypothetical protein [Candidatus Falkowbacteria bacterium]MBT4433057.1 hypothetical protein [Candidatus Falkowbacteria bacterium]